MKGLPFKSVAFIDDTHLIAGGHDAMPYLLALSLATKTFLCCCLSAPHPPSLHIELESCGVIICVRCAGFFSLACMVQLLFCL